MDSSANPTPETTPRRDADVYLSVIATQCALAAPQSVAELAAAE
jgi:hypothetical protein